MDPIANPYRPGPGIAPAELAGRGNVRNAARITIERLRRGCPAQNLLLVGLRGVGKTVLLDQISADAVKTGIITVRVGAAAGRSLPSLLAPALRLELLRLSRVEGSKEAAIRALRALAGFVTSLKPKLRDLELGLDYEPETGWADSGVLPEDLGALLLSVGTVALQSGSAVVLFIDELQFLSAPELAALTIALRRCAQRSLPIALVGAGLPHLRVLMTAGGSRECPLECFELGPLSPEAAALALLNPAAQFNVQYEPAAVTNIQSATQCYPYFLQELAKHAWDVAPQSPITPQDVRHAAHMALAALDEKFFRIHIDRLPRAERKYLRGMAELGAGPHRSGDIAAALNRPVTSLGPARSHLIAKGVIWSPSHGDTAFAIPRFDQYLRRTWSGGAWRN